MVHLSRRQILLGPFLNTLPHISAWFLQGETVFSQLGKESECGYSDLLLSAYFSVLAFQLTFNCSDSTIETL